MKTFHTFILFFVGLSTLLANAPHDTSLKCATVNFNTEEVIAFDNVAYLNQMENITLYNDSEEDMTLETMTLEYMKGDQVLYVANLFAEDIYKAANNAFEYSKSGLYEELAPCGRVLAFSRTMAAGECLVIQGKTFVLNDMPDKVRITAKAASGDATMVELSYEISLSQKIAPVNLPAFAG